MMKGENKSPDYLSKIRWGRCLLELMMERYFAESVAICRYIEESFTRTASFRRDAD